MSLIARLTGMFRIFGSRLRRHGSQSRGVAHVRRKVAARSAWAVQSTCAAWRNRTGRSAGHFTVGNVIPMEALPEPRPTCPRELLPAWAVPGSTYVVDRYNIVMSFVRRREWLTRVAPTRPRCPQCGEQEQIQLVWYVRCYPAEWRCRTCKCLLSFEPSDAPEHTFPGSIVTK